jgi:DNA recombination protein Rad52
MSFDEKQIKALKAKLDPAHIVKPKGQFGPKGDYIEGWFAIYEANQIFGFDGWSYEIVSLTGCHEPYENANGNWTAGYVALIRVTVADVTREDVGYGSGASKQIGDAHESAVKEAVTDALKRALRTFGNRFGLALYDKSRANVGAPEPDPEVKALYAQGCMAVIKQAKTVEDLNVWWKDQAPERRKHGLTSDDVNELAEACATQKAKIKAEMNVLEAG